MNTIRILSFAGMVGGALFLPFWYFIPFVFLYALFFTPYELLALAVLIDAEFGSGGLFSGYAYTMTVALVMMATITMKPYLRFYI